MARYLWMSIFHLNPCIAGGCRTISLDLFMDLQEWRVVHKKVVTPFGVPLEVLSLSSIGMPNKAAYRIADKPGAH